MLLLVASSNRGFSQNSCFTSIDYFSSTGVSARCIEKGDFNEDGHLDIALGIFTVSPTNQLAIFLGNGDGTFGSSTLFSIGPRPLDLKTYDFNGDGHLDIVSANNNGHTISVVFGTGTGSFGAATNYSTGASSGPNGISIGDFDMDGIKDLVVSVQASGSGFMYFKGISGGTFNAGINYAIAGSPLGITSADFNGDGKLDVATCNSGATNIGVRLGNGDGTFAVVTNYAAQTAPYNIESGDLNGDGFVDLACTNETTGSISVFIGNGTGTFAVADNYASGTGTDGLIFDDFNEDSKLDIACVNNSENTVSLFTNTGINTPGNRFTKIKYSGTGNPKNLINGDFNEDTHADLVVPSSVGTKLVVMIGDGNGFFASGQSIVTETGPNDVVIGDFNSDGKSDLVSANKTANSISYFSGNGDGTYATKVDVTVGTSPVALYAYDVNNDSKLDIVTANSGSNNISVLFGDGAGGFAAAVNYAVGTTPSDIICANINGDVNIDIAVSNSGSNNFSVLLGSGAGAFGAATNFSVGTDPTGIVAANFNADGNIDIATSNGSSNNVTVIFGNGSGSFASAANFSTANNPRGIDAADMDNDGDQDIVTANYSSNNVSVLMGNGAGSFAAATNYTTDVKPQAIKIADFNNDGLKDVVTCNEVATGATSTVSLLMGTGGGSLGTTKNFSASTNSLGIAAGDVNGDGLIDVATSNFTANNITILLNNTAVITPSSSTTFCAGGSVNLVSSIADVYSWSTGASTNSINVTLSGTYYVITSPANGFCTSRSNNINVTVNPTPDITGFTGNDTICPSSSTTITANCAVGGANIQWYSAASGGTLLHTGASYITPVLGATTTYYVYAFVPGTGCDISPREPIQIVINDVTDPVITGMPSNITLSAGAGCSAVATWTAPNATDNCTLSSFVCSHASGSSFPTGTTTVTYTATDAFSNVATASFTVTVNDNTAPVISGTPTTITVNVAAGTCAQIVTWTAPTATDNCSLSSLIGSHTSGSSFPVGTTVVTYTATDASSNVSTSTFNVVVVDNINPAITGTPSNITLNASSSSCGATATWTAPTASDNCAIATFTGSHTSGSTFPIGTTTVTYTATDVNSNTSTSSFTVTVNDVTNPTITGTPSNITTNATAGSCSATVSWTAPTASDNCSVSSFTASNSPGSSFPVGTTTVTYTATDASGNSSATSFTVTVVDAQNPTFSSFPTNQTVTVTPGTCAKVATWTNPTAADNCGVSSVTSTHTSGSSFPTGVTTVTYTVTDINGNVHTQSFNITVVDNEAPVMSGCPTTQTVCEGTTVTFPTPTATDNCSGVTVTQIAGLPSGSTFPVGTTLCTFRATDASGNITNCNFNIIVNAGPTVSFSYPTSITCVNYGPLTLSGGSPSGGTYSGTGVAGTSFNPTTAGTGTHTITYTFTNGSGCSGTATDNITVDACLGNFEVENLNTATVYPNPGQGIFTLKVSSEISLDDVKVSVYNPVGAMIHQQDVRSTETTFDLSEFANGVYLVKVIGTSVNTTLPLIIQK